jgi:probable F420-dependent oxidoreductase
MEFVASLAFSDPHHYCALAAAADACGWNAFVLPDHVVHPEKIESPYPYTKDGSTRWEAPAPFPDPWVATGAMAAVTTRLRFMTGIYILPLRNPFQVAKTVGTAAVMSHDRVTLGIGMGWMKDEFELMEQPFAERGRRADEMVEVMRKLWRGGMVEHHGEFYDFDRLQMSPAPRAEIPIVVGGLSEPALRRAAQVGDGWISDLHSFDELRRIVAKLRAYRADGPRAGRPLQVIAACTDATGVDGCRRLEDVGVTHLQTMPWLFYGGHTDSLEGKRAGIERFAEDVIARM